MILFKKIVYRLLCNSFTNKIIEFLFGKSIPDIRWRRYAFNLTDIGRNHSIYASVFWGFYESSEIRFVEKYFKGNLDVIEFGGSCGVVTSHIVSKLNQNKKLISVEANKQLRLVWEINTQRHNTKLAEIELVNKAIHYDSVEVNFYISRNTTESSSKKNDVNNSNSFIIPAITLKEIIDLYKVNEYILVCDIEGSEIQILLNENDAFKFCQSIIIELHSTVHNGISYSISQLENLILQKGFKRISNHGPVYYFEKAK